MKLRRLLVAAVLGAGLANCAFGEGVTTGTAPANAPVGMVVPQFQKGDRWGVVGDSITHNGSYHKWIYLFYATRFPERRFEMFNLGIAGDTAGKANGRVEWDILPRKANVYTISMGMNDVGRGNYAKSKVESGKEARAKSLATYEGEMRKLAGALQAAGGRIIFVSTTPVDDTADMSPEKDAGSVDINVGLRSTMDIEEKIAQGMVPVAPVVDFFDPLHELTLKYQASDPRFTFVRSDRVHPEAVGHFVLAYAFLKAQKLEGVVSKMEVDANGGKVVEAENCAIDKVTAADGGVAFGCLEKSLPCPVGKEEMAALKMVPFVEEFDREILQVDHLGAGKYRVEIDGEVVGEYSAEELGSGVNLAMNEKTPMWKQAAGAMKLNDERHDLERTDGRLVPYVEWHFGLPKGAEDKSILEMAAKGKSTNAFVQSQYDGYAETKGRVGEIAKHVDELRGELWGAVLPVGHGFRVVKVEPGEKN